MIWKQHWDFLSVLSSVFEGLVMSAECINKENKSPFSFNSTLKWACVCICRAFTDTATRNWGAELYFSDLHERKNRSGQISLLSYQNTITCWKHPMEEKESVCVCVRLTRPALELHTEVFADGGTGVCPEQTTVDKNLTSPPVLTFIQHLLQEDRQRNSMFLFRYIHSTPFIFPAVVSFPPGRKTQRV